AAVLVFAVPIPAPLLNYIVWHLQIGTADFTGLLLQMVGVPVLVSGDRILLREGLFAIIETCSGLRSIETLALLSILMIDLFGRRGVHAAILLLISPIVAFLINGLRCLGLIFNPHADIESIHSLQGILMLLGGVLLLYFIDGLLERVIPEPERISAIERRARSGARPRAGLAPRVAVLAGFSAALFAISWLPRSPPSPGSPPPRPGRPTPTPPRPRGRARRADGPPPPSIPMGCPGGSPPPRGSSPAATRTGRRASSYSSGSQARRRACAAI